MHYVDKKEDWLLQKLYIYVYIKQYDLYALYAAFLSLYGKIVTRWYISAIWGEITLKTAKNGWKWVKWTKNERKKQLYTKKTVKKRKNF